MTSVSQQSPINASQHRPNMVLGGEGEHPSTQHKTSNSVLTNAKSITSIDDASTSMHTATDEPMKNPIQLESLSIGKAEGMNIQIDQHFHSTITTIAVSSTEDLKELEEDDTAQRLIQQEIGDHYKNVSDLPLVSRKAHAPFSPQSIAVKSSEPPSEQEQEQTLPLKRASPLWRRVRYRLLAVYQRLFSIVLVANMIAILTVLIRDRTSRPFGPPIKYMASAVAANITSAILIRQEFFINALYNVFCWTPLWIPLRFRRIIAKLYHFGGIHSGCAVSAVIWYILFTAFLTKEYIGDNFGATTIETTILSITYILLFLFLAITIFAIPKFRVVSHNTFEMIHRFGGWLAIALFWILLLLLNYTQSQQRGSQSLGLLIIQAPSFWLLLVATICIVIPWLRLRYVPVQAEQLSNHAIRLHFNYIKIGPVAGIRIATSPLMEWHAFAAIPSPDRSSFSLIVSDAGDWTKYQIANPSTRYWVRGIPVSGVLRMAAVFRKVIIVTTGSGIGPVLSMALSSSRLATTRIIWSTPAPLDTYGQGIINAVTSVDRDAVIWNTRQQGRPHMMALTYQLYKESGAEAVFVISNPSLTCKLVYGMEARGVPAFGPIWDS